MSRNNTVVVEQQIFLSVQIRSGLIPVIDIKPWLRKSRGHLLELLLLHLRVAGEVLPFTLGRLRSCERRQLIPLRRRPIGLFDRLIDDLTHHEAEDKKHNDEAKKATQEDSNTACIDVCCFITREIGVAAMR